MSVIMGRELGIVSLVIFAPDSDTVATTSNTEWALIWRSIHRSPDRFLKFLVKKDAAERWLVTCENHPTNPALLKAILFARLMDPPVSFATMIQVMNTVQVILHVPPYTTIMKDWIGRFASAVFSRGLNMHAGDVRDWTEPTIVFEVQALDRNRRGKERLVSVRWPLLGPTRVLPDGTRQWVFPRMRDDEGPGAVLGVS